PDAAGDRAGVHDVRVVRVDQQRARAAADVAGAERAPGGGRLRADACGAERRLAKGELLHARNALARGGVAGVDLGLGGDAALLREVARRFVRRILSRFAVDCWPLAVPAGDEREEDNGQRPTANGE